MPRVGARGALTALVVGVLLLSGGIAGAQALARRTVDAALAERGLAWKSTSHGFRHLSYQRLQGDGVRAERLQVDLLAREARLQVVEVVLGGGGGGGGGGGAEGVALGFSGRLDVLEERVAAVQAAGAAAGVRGLHVEGLTVSYGDQVLLSGLSGTVVPQLDLAGDASTVAQEGTHLRMEATRAVDVGPLYGEVQLRLDTGAEVWLVAKMPAALVLHRRLAPRAVGPLRVELTLERSTADELRLVVEGVEVRVRSEAEGTWAVDLPPTELADLIGAMSTAVPELSRTQIGGRVAFDGKLSGPPWALVGEVSVPEKLTVRGLLSDPASLRRGGITWRVHDPSGGVAVREAAPNVATWVRPSEARLLVAAVLAAEDSGFRTHPGFDPIAIREALDAMAQDVQEGRELRLLGASTLTQQLAKNLFLDPNERTLARKLRELLYAVELEQTVGKERILELYLNIVEMGPGLYGMGAAADAFFLKRARGLSVREAAYLAYVLPAPGLRYHQHYLVNRPPLAPLDGIIDNMLDAGSISPAEAARAHADTLRFVPPAR